MNEEILRDINYQIERLLERGRSLVEDEEIMDKIECTKEELEHFIRKNPLKSLGIGLFTGYIIGKIFSSDD